MLRFLLMTVMAVLLRAPQSHAGEVGLLGIEEDILAVDVIFDGVYLGSDHNPADRRSLLEWAQEGEEEEPYSFDEADPAYRFNVEFRGQRSHARNLPCRHYYRVTDSWKGDVEGLVVVYGFGETELDCGFLSHNIQTGDRVFQMQFRDRYGDIYDSHSGLVNPRNEPHYRRALISMGYAIPD